MSTTAAGVVASPAAKESSALSICSTRAVNAGSIETSAAEGVSALSRGTGADSLAAEDSAPAVAAAAMSGDGPNGSFGTSSSDAAGGASLDVFVDASADAVGGTSGFPFGVD